MTIPAGFDVKQANIVSAWPHDRPMLACRFDPQGRYVFTGSEDALVERFQLTDGTRALLSGGHKTWVKAITFTSDAAFTITGGCDGQLTWWETAAAAPTPIRTIAAHQGWVRALATSPDGKLIASGGNDGMVRIWNPADGAPIRELKGHTNDIYSVLFHPTEPFLLSGDLVGVIKQWDLNTGLEVRTFDAKPLTSNNAAGQGVDFGGVRAMAISADSTWLVAGGLYKATNPLGAVHEPLVLLFDWKTQKLERQLITDNIPAGVIERLIWLADGSLMGISCSNSGGILLFWKPDAEKDYHRIGYPNFARDMDLHVDGIQVATTHHDRHVRITRLAAPPAKPA